MLRMVPTLPVLFFLLSCLLLSEPVEACRYNVRDVGFVDLGDEPYRVFLLVDDGAPTGFVDLFRKTARSVFLETNVRVEVVRVSEERVPEEDGLDEEMREVVQRASRLGVTRFPALVLLDPAGRLLQLRLAAPTTTGRDALRELLEDVVISRKRGELLEMLPDVYAVVLLVEGRDPAANTRAAKVARAAIGEIEAKLGELPKAIGKPPALLTVGLPLQRTERILLWALGIATEREDYPGGEPYCAVVYGRGKLMGPLLEGPAIGQTALFQALHLIGQSCECDLDRGWVNGKLLPLHWSRSTRARFAELLGFDPDNPLIRTEISRILARGPGSAARDSVPLRETDPLLGYREFEVDTGGPSQEKPGNGILIGDELDRLIAATEAESRGSPGSPALDRSASRDEGDVEDKGATVVMETDYLTWILGGTAGALLLLSLIGGLVLAVRAGSRS